MKHIKLYEDFLNEGSKEIKNIKVGTVLNFKGGETWKVTKIIGSPSDPRGVLAAPFGDTKKNYVSLAIEFSMDYLSDNLESLEESYSAFLGGNSNFTDAEMRKNVVEPTLGKSYDAYVMFEGPKGEYDEMKAKYAAGSDRWKNLWRSMSGQSYADISPDGKVIKAAVFAKGGIVGAIYVKK